MIAPAGAMLAVAAARGKTASGYSGNEDGRPCSDAPRRLVNLVLCTTPYRRVPSSMLE